MPKREVIFEHSPSPAYLAVVDADSYRFFASPDIDYDGMLAHLGKQMAICTCVAWGCPDSDLTVRLVFTRDHAAFESIKQYASGFTRWVRTAGRLYFSSHADLFHCASNPEWTVFSLPRPDVYLSRELVVPRASTLLQSFGTFPGLRASRTLRCLVTARTTLSYSGIRKTTCPFSIVNRQILFRGHGNASSLAA